MNSNQKHQQNTVLLPRLLGLRDHSPFILIVDTVAQSAQYLIQEIFHRIPSDTNVIQLNFESINIHSRVNKVIDGISVSNIEKLQKEVLATIKNDLSKYL